MKPLLLLALLLPSCASLGYKPGCMVVDVSEKRAVIEGKAFPVATAYRGTGGEPGSKRTPIGTLEVIAKEPRHRFGPVLRLGGVSEDGYCQDDRGVLIHRTRKPIAIAGSSGCLVFRPVDIPLIYASLDVGDTVKIMP